MSGILKKLIIPALVTLILLAVWGGAFYVFVEYGFFARNLRRLMYVVFIALGLCIPLAFIAETREVVRDARRQRKVQLQKEIQQKEEQDKALRQAAELLSGHVPDEEPEPEADQ